MDEVSGWGVSSGAIQSDNYGNNNTCDQCAESRKVIRTAGFCRTCTDFLCEDCLVQHKTLRGFKSHQLLEGEDMPNQKPASSYVEKCPVHFDRPIEAYCTIENIFGCSLCFIIGHRSCQNVALVADLSCGIESSKELLDVQKAAEKHKILEDTYREAIKKLQSVNEHCHTKSLEEFKQFRSEMLEFIDTLGEKVHQEAETLKQENDKKLNELSKNITSYSEQLKSLMMKIEEMKRLKHREQLFVALKRNGTNVIDSVESMENLNQGMTIKHFSFQSNVTIKDSLKEACKVNIETHPMSGLRKEPVGNDNSTRVRKASSPAVRCISATEVNIGSTNNISSVLELSATQLLICFRNTNMKLFDMTSDTITTTRAFTSRCWNATKIPGHRIAVTFPDKEQIMFFTADHNLDLCGKIDVTGKCYGIQYAKDRLVVSFISPQAQVQLIDLTGRVLKTIQQDPSGNALFECPQYIALSADSKLIYVSDTKRNTIFCIDTAGVIQWVYRDQELQGPRGVVAGDGGCIYICSLYNNTMHVVSSYGVRLSIIPQSHSGVIDPQALCNSSNSRTLYVSYGIFLSGSIKRLTLSTDRFKAVTDGFSLCVLCLALCFFFTFAFTLFAFVYW